MACITSHPGELLPSQGHSLSTGGLGVSQLSSYSYPFAIVTLAHNKKPRRSAACDYLKAVNPARLPLAPIRHRPLADANLRPDLGIAQALRPKRQSRPDGLC